MTDTDPRTHHGAALLHIADLNRKNADLLRENAELRANNARLREAMELIRKHGSKDGYWQFADISACALAETPAASLEAVRAEEREACAKIAHHYWVRWDHPTNMKCAETIEKAIRARGDGGEQAGD